MSHRLSQLLGGLQSKLDAAVQSYNGGQNSYGPHPSGAQPPYGAPNAYNPPQPYGPHPQQGVQGPYGPPQDYTPHAPYAPPSHPPAHGAPYPDESPFPQAPLTPHDVPPSHSGPSGTHDAYNINLNPDTLGPYGSSLGAPPHFSTSSCYGGSYGTPHQPAAPSTHGAPAQAVAPYGAPAQYTSPPPAVSPNPPYGQHNQHPPPQPCGHNTSGPPAPYGAPNFPPSQSQPPPAPSTFHSRLAIRSGGLAGGSTTIHDASNPSSSPIYTFRTSSSKPHVVMLHPDGTELGHASISSTLTNVDLSLRGRSMAMKQSEMGDEFTIESHRGKFVWTIDEMKGCLGEMMDENKTVVARYKGGDVPGVGERGVEVCVECDQEMFEIVLLSTMAGRALNKKNVKVGMKIFKHAMMGA